MPKKKTQAENQLALTVDPALVAAMREAATKGRTYTTATPCHSADARLRRAVLAYLDALDAATENGQMDKFSSTG